MLSILLTERLVIEPISETDHLFILELLNSEGWLKYIGDRNIHSAPEAIAYIEKLKHNTAVTCLAVKLKADRTAIGIITFIKHDYLDYHDIGFAFLPAYNNQGYAYEATNAILKKIALLYDGKYILGSTLPENVNSVKLLKKLGLQFRNELVIEDELLNVYAIATESIQ